MATDFSEASRQAFEAARRLAQDLGAGIVLVHVTPRVLRKDPDMKGRVGQHLTPPEAAVQDAVRLSSEWASRLRADGVFVKSLNPTGAPAATVVDLAVKHGCSAIVVATTGRTLRSLLVGSVAREVLQRSPLPVLVVPARASHKGKQPRASGAASKTLLVAVDFSEESERAFDAAVALAKDLHAPVQALHVVPLALEVAPFPLGAEVAAEAVESEEESSLEQLGLLANRARRSKVAVVPAVQVGHAATAILAEARAQGAALIVVGSHGRSGARRFFLGSVAQSVAQLADRPVLVVPGGPARGDWRR